MEVNADNLATLANYLQQTLNPDPNLRRPAEKFLESIEVNQNYAILLLHLIDKEDVELAVRIAAAIAFKNYIKRNWPVEEDGDDRIHASDRNTIKTLIVSLMLKSPESIQRQFSVAVTCIGLYDFPQKWPSLLPELVDKFATGDFHVINGILRTAHSLFKRYRYEFKSQRLWEEIKHVLDNFAKPLTDLFVASTEQPGVLEQLRTEVCECAALYALKYEEEFAPHASSFVVAVWTVLLSTNAEQRYDSLVSNALTFLAKVAEKNCYKSLFEDPGTLSSICEKVVIPNMEFRESDMELFEDNPEEYVRRDIEGSDVNTRRTAACDLVHTLALNYEDRMMNIFGQYVQLMLQKYNAEGASCWRGKDAAMYLVTSLASRGSTQASGVTKASPLVDINQFAANHVVPELQRPDINELPVLKADAIKYLMTFRSLLPKQLLINSLPLLIQHVNTCGVVSTYAACCIEKLIAAGIVGGDALTPHAGPLLSKLFAVLGDVSDPARHNEYVMKAILRTLSSLQAAALPYLGEALPKLAHMLAVVSKNPCKPHFNHYLFETLSVVRLNAMLGVFQKLIASKTNDHEGFYLVQTMLYKFGGPVMQPYLKQIMMLLFQRLSSSKTTKFIRGLIAFLGFYAAHMGADSLVELIDSVQTNLFAMYVERILLPDLQKVTGSLERKAAAIGCVRLLADCQRMRVNPLARYWTPLLQALISLFELPADEYSLPDDHFVEVDDTPGYEAQYAQLTCARKTSEDPLGSIEDPKRFLAERLGALSAVAPGILPPLLSQLDDSHCKVLNNYLSVYSVQIC
ncbi:hypothetical protein ACJJTC_008162 [Scirpophaga incertulas]